VQNHSQVRPGSVLAILCIASFMANLDLFVVNVAFDDIGRQFGAASLGDLSWILNGYAIVYAALLVPLGRLSDRFGRKEGFLLGLGVFTLASLACALSPGLWWLVGFRVLQAVGAAALTPTSLGLLLTAMPPERRAVSVRIWAATGALAAAIGPVLGGVLTEASWRWVFLINLPIGIAALVAAGRRVPDSTDSGARVPDLLGAAIAVVAIGALALGLVKGPDWDWTATPTVASFVVAVLAGLWFARRSVTHPVPVLDPSLLRVRAYAWAGVTMVLFSIAFAIGLLGGILWLQQVWGYSAIRTGLAIAPGPLMVPVFAVVAQRMAHRVPAGVLVAAGCLAMAVGAALTLVSVGPEPAYAREILPGWLIAGVGVGLTLPTLMSSATAELPPHLAATGSAVVNMARQLGTVLGVSALVVLIGSPDRYDVVHRGFQHAWAAGAVFSVIAAVAALGMTTRSPAAAPAPVTP
jgi:EmrB/QacA subfamily drug resistance transporter